MLKTRSRIINFRVTEDEFTKLKDAATGEGARCLSDYARATILNGLGGTRIQLQVQDDHEDRLQALTRRLGLVEQSISKLEMFLTRLAAFDRDEISVGAHV